MDPINSSSDLFTPDEESTGDKIKNNIFELIQFIAVAGAILVILRFFVAEPHRVSGSSMVPNFHDGDYIITNKLPTRFDSFQRGEVVILENPRNNDQVFIKRVIGLPGEKVTIFNGAVYINGQPLLETYLPQGLKTPGGSYLPEGEEIVVPDDQFFVIGDNRSGSSDSREWGPVQKKLLIGQAWLRYWPLNKFTLIQINKSST